MIDYEIISIATDNQLGQTFSFLLCTICAAIASALVVLGFFSDNWLGEIACSFRPYYSILLLIAACTLSVLKRRLLGVMFCGVALLNAFTFFALYVRAADSKSQEPVDIKIMQVNVCNDNRRFANLAEYISKTQPDLIAIEEYTLDCEKSLSGALEPYKYRVCLPQSSYYGIAIYSKLEIVTHDIFLPHVSGPYEPAIICKVLKNGRPFQVAAVHVYAPHHPTQKALRDEQLNQLALRLKPAGVPTIILGDLNTTPWSSAYVQFLSKVKLKDGQIGFGVQPTCSLKGLLWVPIDYCLIPMQSNVTSYSVGPQFGSDHCPVLVDVLL